MPSSRVAALQMVSTPEVMANLGSADRLIAAAAAAGARLVALPENFYLIGRHEADKVRVREPEGEGPIQGFLAAAARRHRVWIVGGTAPISCADPGRIRSACLVFDDTGRDRKSTRLNSSHSQISYAVFCLKKKKKKNTTIHNSNK